MGSPPLSATVSLITGAETTSATSPGLTADQLCDRYAEQVFRFASMVAGSDLEAEDLAQTALEKAIVALPTFDPRRGEPGPWLWRITVNAARDAGRAARRRQLVLQRLILLDLHRPAPDDIPAGVDDGRLLDAVRRLTRLQRSVIALRYGADLDYAEIGRALGISKAAAVMAGHRALRALRRSLLEADR